MSSSVEVQQPRTGLVILAVAAFIFLPAFQCAPLHSTSDAGPLSFGPPGAFADGGFLGQWNGLGPNPCAARNPVPLVGPVKVTEFEDDQGERHEECTDKQEHNETWNKHCRVDGGSQFSFTIAAQANVCLRAQATVSLHDAIRIQGAVGRAPLVNWDLTIKESDGGLNCEGTEEGDSVHGAYNERKPCPSLEVGLPLTLPAGTYGVSAKALEHVADLDNVTLSVFAQGPYIDSFVPVVAHTGDDLALKGEGFYPGTTLAIGGLTYPVHSIAADGTAITSTVPPHSPIGSFYVSNAIGSSTSASPFTPLEPKGLVHFFPASTFNIDDSGSCVAPKRLEILQDGSVLSFVMTTYRQLPNATSLDIAVEEDGNLASPEHVLHLESSAEGPVARGTPNVHGAIDPNHLAVSVPFDELDLRDPAMVGHFLTRISVSAPCGQTQYPLPSAPHKGFIDVRSAFAPGILVVETLDPAGVAARHALTQLSQDDGAHIIAMGFRGIRSFDDVFLDVLADPNVIATIPDPVSYPNETGGLECGDEISAASFETGHNPLQQWYLESIHAPDPIPASAGAGITVAVIGAGVDPVPELAQALVPGINVLIVGNDGTTTDSDSDTGHDTMVASLIASAQGNGGIVGVAPSAKILPVKTMHCFGAVGCAGEGISTMLAFNQLRDRHKVDSSLRVVNVSNSEFTDLILELTGIGVVLTGGDGTLALGQKILGDGLGLGAIMHRSARKMVEDGVSLVVSVGNSRRMLLEAPFGAQYPANLEEAFTVAGVDELGILDPDSTPADTIKISAPSTTSRGGGLRGARNNAQIAMTPNDPFQCAGGTSFAAPLVAGAIAFVNSPAGTPTPLTGVQVQQLLLDGARTLSDTDFHDVGRGELDLERTLNRINNPISTAYDNVPDMLSDLDFDSQNRAWVVGSAGKVGFLSNLEPSGTLIQVGTLPPGVSAAWIRVRDQIGGSSVTQIAVGQQGNGRIEVLGLVPAPSGGFQIHTAASVDFGVPIVGRGVLLELASDRTYLAVPLDNQNVGVVDLFSTSIVPIVIPTSGPIIGLANVGGPGAGRLAAFGPEGASQRVEFFDWSFDATTGAGFTVTNHGAPIVFGTGPVTAGEFGAADQFGNAAFFLTTTSAGAVVRVSTTDGTVTLPFSEAERTGLSNLRLDSVVYSQQHQKLIVSEPSGHIFLLDGRSGSLLNESFDSVPTADLLPMRMSKDGVVALSPDQGGVLGTNGHPPTSNGVLVVTGF